MSYKALYRTYRPQTFKDVTGQEVVVKTLQNAISNKKISHAYLFSGPRGTGKTSVARIFAKALNCVNESNGEPCDNCISCSEISEGYNPDVIEIDAASNNGVDEIRDIREKVKFLPSGSKYKIYIIDEVHMLSGGAFNALLKTLEEPPKHAIFILATTEPQKLPATIISRCQRFEFKALNVVEITQKLKEICELEGVSITEEALNSISESAEGGMRDALSILDQAISYGNKNIEIEDINGVTGSLSFEKIITLAEAIDQKDVHKTIESVNDLISSGKEVTKIINSLLVFFRDLLLYKNIGNSEFDKYIYSKQQFIDLANNIAMPKIMYYVDVLTDVQNKVKNSSTANIFLEIALIKMCNISVDELDVLKKVNDLEEKIANIGNIEIGSSNYNNVDDEKVTMLDARVNQIVSELNRLELSKQIEKLNFLSEKVNNTFVNNQDTHQYDSEIEYLKSKIDELDLFVNKDMSDSEPENVDLSDVYQRIEKLENNKTQIVSNQPINLEPVYKKIEQLEQTNNKDIDEKISSMEDTILSLMEELEQAKNNLNTSNHVSYEKNENVDLSEMSDKLMFLERRVYQIMAGELAYKKNAKKEVKKNNNQIMLFGDDLLTIADYDKNNKEKFDFDDLEKPQEQIILEEEYEQEEVVENISNQDSFDNEFSFNTSSNESIDEEVEEEFEQEEPQVPEHLEEEYEQEEVEQQEDVFENDITEEQQRFTLESLRSSEPVTPKVEQPVIQQQVQPEKQQSRGLFETASGIIERPKVEKKTNNIVSQYFDVQNNQEVIIKEHSSLVVREKQSYDENYVLEKDLIARENNSNYSSSNQNSSFTSNNNQNEQNVFGSGVEHSMNIDKLASYDVKNIEQILHDSRAIESKNDKIRIEQLWKIMTRGARPEYLSIMETLQEGKIAVVGNKEFILVFPGVTLCNQVMRPKFKDIAVRILYNLLGDTYNYIALPIDIWTAKSKEYKEQYQIGIKYPKLTQFELNGLEVFSAEEEYKNENEKAINQTIRMFGEGNVKVE